MLKHIIAKSLSLVLSLCVLAGGGGLTAEAASPYVVREYDLTDAGGGDTAALPCVWVQKYDDTHHWDECQNHKTAGSYGTPAVVHGAGGIWGSKIAHAKTNNGVVYTTSSCHVNAPDRIESCACGWSYKVPKPAHVRDDTVIPMPLEAYHFWKCKNCTQHAAGGSGDCISVSGVTGRCNVDYVCRVCNGHVKNVHTFYAYLDATTQTYKCEYCHVPLGIGSLELISAKDCELKFRNTGILTYPGATRELNSFGAYAHDYQGTGTLTVVPLTNNSTSTSWDYTFTVTSDKANTEALAMITYTQANLGGNPMIFRSFGYACGYNYPNTNDVTPPTYIIHTTNPVITAGSWAIQRDITVTFSDQTTNYVDIGLTNAAGVFLVPYGRAVQNGIEYTRTFRLMVDAPSSGATFFVTARDRSGNETKKQISLSYTDAVAPSSLSVTGYNTTWTKSKTLRLTATELGSGAVEMAFNKEADYTIAVQNGTSYYRDFIMKGTVASPIEQSFLVRDALGNATTLKYMIGYLDNTLPAMTLTQNPDTTGANWYRGDIVITVALTDEHSGLSTLTVPGGLTPVGSINLAGVKSATRTFVARQPGTYNFTVTDIAGNQVTKSITVTRVDNIDPGLMTA